MKRCLLLNAWYLPSRILEWQDAVMMWAKGTVDVIVEYDETISSPSISIRCPAVIRLRKETPRKKKNVKFSRVAVYTRDNWTCQYCGKRCGFAELTYDHVQPRSRGGQTNFLNVVASCISCNSKKGNRTCDEISMWPRQPPFVPKSLPIQSGLLEVRNMEPEWVGFLRKKE